MVLLKSFEFRSSLRSINVSSVIYQEKPMCSPNERLKSNVQNVLRNK